jgi:PST family polysaccharide transporter
MPFARILRSSALMGGAQVVVLAAGFVRAKAIALILGASGVGLIGIFNAFSGNISSLAGWGLGTSGVRLIAGADADAKPAKVAAVRRMGWTLSLLGLGLGLLAFWPTARLTFASSEYATEMAIVALAVPCVIASSAWSAILQASGKIGSLAKVQIAGALTGLLLGLPAIYFWGTLGIALSILLAAAVPAFVLWRTARSESAAGSLAQVDGADLRQLVTLGGALMVVGWLGQLSAYLVRLTIVRHAGLEAAGYYQAAFAISGSLPGFVFAAMGADFFPRVAAAKDEAEAREVTERQIQGGLLLGTPIVMALLALGKLSLHLLYARSFDAALPLLAWMTWGVFIRLMTWPLGFWLLARGSGRMVVMIESIGALFAALLPMVLIGRFGLVSAAIAIAISSAVYGVAVAIVFRSRSGEWFSAETHLWAGLAAVTLAAGQWWSAGQANEYAGCAPVVLVAVACAWLYRRQVGRVIPSKADR